MTHVLIVCTALLWVKLQINYAHKYRVIAHIFWIPFRCAYAPPMHMSHTCIHKINTCVADMFWVFVQSKQCIYMLHIVICVCRVYAWRMYSIIWFINTSYLVIHALACPLHYHFWYFNSFRKLIPGVDFYLKKKHIYFKEPPLTSVNILGLNTIWVMVFLACSVLSLVFFGYFYCICMLHIVFNNDPLKRVLRAVTKNGTYTALYWHYLVIQVNMIFILDLL